MNKTKPSCFRRGKIIWDTKYEIQDTSNADKIGSRVRRVTIGHLIAI